MCGQGREGVKMSTATELKLPLKTNLTPEEQQLNAQLLAFNLINIDFVDWNDGYTRDYWYEDFDVFIIKLLPNETINALLNRQSLDSIPGYWYGDQAIKDAQEIFERTRNFYTGTAKLLMLIRRYAGE
jgi:hypothetical protein